MISVGIFTYRRLDRLNKCINSISLNCVNEILIFNDDELNKLEISHFNIKTELINIIKIFNPSDFGFYKRAFRKPIYLNKAVSFASNHSILFSDDDGIFHKNTVEKHANSLERYEFCVGSIIRNRIFPIRSKSILQGTNYSFRIKFFKKIGGYDENFVKSMGGGDIDFWLRIYKYVKVHNSRVAFLPNACQNVAFNTNRQKNVKTMDPKRYTSNKHSINSQLPMYKWFPEIRDKKKWMDIIDD